MGKQTTKIMDASKEGAKGEPKPPQGGARPAKEASPQSARPEAAAPRTPQAPQTGQALRQGSGQAPKPEAPRKPKKARHEVPVGVAHIYARFNNTVITITDPSGNVIAWSSAGVRGFKGSRKGTPFAATQAAEDAGRKAHELGVRTVSALIKGPGSGRESALRALASTGIKITVIRDVTPIPHNGCRAPKRRRV